MPIYLFNDDVDDIEIFGTAESISDAVNAVCDSLKRDLGRKWSKILVKQIKQNPTKYITECNGRQIENIKRNYLVLNQD